MNGVLVGLFGYFYLYRYKLGRCKTASVGSQSDYIVGKGFGSIVTGLPKRQPSQADMRYRPCSPQVPSWFSCTLPGDFAPFFDFLCWRYIAPKIKKLSVNHKSLTTVDLLASLKGDPTGMIRILSGVAVTLFMFAYLGSNIIAAGKAADVLKVDYLTAVLASSALVMLYVMVGGVTSAYWAEAFQGMLMVVMCIYMPYAAIMELGGVREFIVKLHQIDPILVSWKGGKAGWPLFVALWMWFGVGIGFLGQPQGLQKFIAVESVDKLPGGAVIGVTFNAIRQYFPIILGLCCRILFPALQDAEMSTPTFINTYFPNFMGGLMLAAVFAAIMSTNSSLLLQGLRALSKRYAEGVPENANKDENYYRRFSRIVTFAFGIVALVLALMKVDSVFSLNLLAWAGLAASFGPGVILAIYWKKTTPQGILAGIVAGMLSAFLWYNGGNSFLGLHQGTPSFLIAGVTVYVVSLLTYREATADQTV